MESREARVAAYIQRLLTKYGASALLSHAGGPESSSSSGESEPLLAAKGGLDAIRRASLPSHEQLAALEAIILPGIRPVVDVIDGDYHAEHPLWSELNDNPGCHQRLRTAIMSVGRIELPHQQVHPYAGTAFIVGERLLMTNRHVAEIFSAGVGSRNLRFKQGWKAGINFTQELGRDAGPTLAVKRVVLIHPYWDMALLETEDLPPEAVPLELWAEDTGVYEPMKVAAIGYPAFDKRADEAEQNDLFHRVFGVKRLQPGMIDGREETESFGKMVNASRHDCTTLGGNSGSALICLENGKVVALHFGGSEWLTNFGVPTSELALDSRVIDAGVHFASRMAPARVPWQSWWDEVDAASAGTLAPSTNMGGE